VTATYTQQNTSLCV